MKLKSRSIPFEISIIIIIPFLLEIHLNKTFLLINCINAFKE